ncbi:hypothetical protein [Actinomadura sp. CNU-125]|uniref:hypothetical protein n=1 Tax=Actinomadura sp. CNU-125 TaxID=1904961 RepID=UPI001651FF78|nr:hypothetical protein [Actinomadura sp. CNU-125]
MQPGAAAHPVGQRDGPRPSQIRSVAGRSGSPASAATIGEVAGRSSSGRPSRSVVCAGTGA